MTFNIEHVMVPVDFSEGSRTAFYVGLQYARLFDAKTTVLHVLEPMTTFDSDFEDIEQTTQEMTQLEESVKHRVNKLFEAGGLDVVDRRRVVVEIRGGKPFIEICRFAHDHKVGLIVMGTHGSTGLKQLFLGSTADRVVRRAPSQVLVVKPEEWEYRPFERIPRSLRL